MLCNRFGDRGIYLSVSPDSCVAIHPIAACHACRSGVCCALKKEIAMRPCLVALCLACLPLTVLADSVHTIEVTNDTRSRIDSFSMAPAGSDHWTEVNFRAPMQESSFDYEVAITMEFH